MEGKDAQRQFIQFPSTLYKTDPAWISPLYLERSQHFSAKNPYFAHARWKAWLAIKDSNVVGRISAQVDELYLERYKTPVGFFGMLEAIDEEAVFNSLFTTGESWLREQNMQHVQGPFNFSINQECGLLVDGFETPPSLMMGHARPYYSTRVEEQGYKPAQDLLAYHIKPDFTVPPAMESLCKNTKKKLHIRPFRRSHKREEFEILRDIFNDAWSNNWGFLPFTKEEFDDIGSMLAILVDDNFINIAELDGEPVAMIAILPNINEIIRDLNGRLFPFGWLKILWRLKVKYPTTARVALMGVRKRYHKSRLGQALAFLMIDAIRGPVLRRGIRDVELSWILKNNTGMCKIIEAIGGIPYKTYRIYEKSLVDDGK